MKGACLINRNSPPAEMDTPHFTKGYYYRRENRFFMIEFFRAKLPYMENGVK